MYMREIFCLFSRPLPKLPSLHARRSILVCQWECSCTRRLALWSRCILTAVLCIRYRIQWVGDTCLRSVRISMMRKRMSFDFRLYLSRNDVLQRPRNYYLINLAITDLGLLLTNNSMHVISSFKKRWIFEQAGIQRTLYQINNYLQWFIHDY